MSTGPNTFVLRAMLAHTPANPFLRPDALRVEQDGALLIEDGRIAASGAYGDVVSRRPEMPVRDLRGGLLLPGFIDTHIHFPQTRIIGGLGHTLLDWLDLIALPEESRMQDSTYAAAVAREFVDALAAHGTTTALVFGAHFGDATARLFHEAERAGLRIVSGMVLSDRGLRPELHQAPQQAFDDSECLIRKYHGRGRLLYAVTPRFALSASEPMLEVCQSLLRVYPQTRFQTHLNENREEIESVRRAFPWAANYLDVYDRYGLIGERSVLAHNVHPIDSELKRIAQLRGAVAHCPCSNAALGSGIFPMRRHLEAGVRFGMGSDVGGGTGFGILKETLQAHLQQRTVADGLVLCPPHMLYLATRAGAEALGLDGETGDFTPGKAADVVYLKPPEDSAFQNVFANARSADHALAAVFALAGAESVRQVYVSGDLVYDSHDVD